MIRHIKFLKNFKSFINATIKGKHKKKNGSKISAGTIKCYKCMHNLIIKYEIHTETELLIPVLRNATRKDYLEVREYWRSFQKNYLSYLFREQNHFDNYVGLNNKVIRTFLNWVKNDKGFDLGDFRSALYIQTEDPPILTFSVNQIKFLIHNNTFHDSLSSALQRSKNILVFGCLTGLRYSDTMTIKQEHIKNMDDEVYLDLYSQKTGAVIILKLPP